MALSNETQQLVLQVVDANQEYNTKFTLIFMLLIYSVIMFGFTYWAERRDKRWDEKSGEFLISRVLLKRAFRWIGGAYIFVFPLMFLLLYRGVAAEILLNLVFGSYIVFFGGLVIFGVMYSWDIVMEFTGLRNFKLNNGKKRR